MSVTLKWSLAEGGLICPCMGCEPGSVGSFVSNLRLRLGTLLRGINHQCTYRPALTVKKYAQGARELSLQSEL
jgi:hypothetical protein